MTIGVTTQGELYSMEYCLRCDQPGPHFLHDERREDVFQCDQCFSMFTDGSLAPSTWLPGRTFSPPVTDPR